MHTPCSLRCPALVCAAAMTTSSVFAFTPLVEDFSGGGLSSSLFGHVASGGSGGGSVLVDSGSLVVTTVAYGNRRAYAGTVSTDMGWGGSSIESVTYAFRLDGVFPTEAAGAAVFFYLAGPGTPGASQLAAPDYHMADSLGLRLTYNAGTDDYTLSFYTKLGQADANLTGGSNQNGSLTITDLTQPIGFTVNPGELTVTLFGGGISTNRTITSVVASTFEDDVALYLQVYSGSSGDSISVRFAEMSATAVQIPEPSACALLAGVGALSGVARRRTR